MKPSRTQLIEQIERYGRSWGLFPMTSTFGDVLVAEEIPAKIPLTEDLSMVVKVKRDITAISQEYPFSSLLANRGQRLRRVQALANEIIFINKMMRKKKAQEKIDNLYGEMTEDFKRSSKTIIMLGDK